MEHIDIKALAEQMTGNYYRYQNETLRVESHRLTDSVLVLHTDKVNVIVPLPEFENYFAAFEKAPPPAVVQQKGLNISTTVIGSSAADLKAICMDNIKKVQSNKDYIPQAQAVNQQIKTIIDLAKAETAMYKALKG